METATPCKNGNEEAFERVAGNRRRNPRFRPNSQKTKHACIVEAPEFWRKRLESTLPRSHEDHMAERVQFDESLKFGASLFLCLER